MRLAIFGAGYVGSSLAMRARDKGWEVHALTRNPERVKALIDGQIHAVQADVVNDGWESELEGDFDLAVSCLSGGGGADGYHHSYVLGNRRLLAWGEARTIGRWIYTGSTSVYPDRGGAWVDEDTALPDPDGPAPEALREAESMFSLLDGKVPWNVLRLAGIYGPDRHLLLRRIMERDGPLPGRGDYYLNLIHRDDIVRAILAIAQKPDFPSGIFNLSDGHPALKSEIVAWLAQQLGKPFPGFDPSLSTRRRPGQAGRGHRPPNRRVQPDRILRSLDLSLNFADFRAGYQGLLEEAIKLKGLR